MAAIREMEKGARYGDAYYVETKRICIMLKRRTGNGKRRNIKEGGGSRRRATLFLLGSGIDEYRNESKTTSARKKSLVNK